MKRMMWPVFILFCLIAGCERSIPKPIVASDYPINNFNDVFEAFWNGMNTRYVFWDWETTNWDKVYQVYKPKFAALGGLSDPVSQDSAIQYLKEMTTGLIDGHYDLQNLDAKGIEFRPSGARKSHDAYFNANHFIPLSYFSQEISKKLDASFSQSSTTIDGEDTVFAIAGTIQKNILYLYFKSFDLGNWYGPGAPLTNTLDFFFDRFTADSTQYKGIIIDVRANFGGHIPDIAFVLGRIIASPVQYGFTRTKTGNGRLDYSPWLPALLIPAQGGKALASSQRLVVLADNWSQSAAEQLTMAIKVLPNSTFIGDTTWGANGPFQDPAEYPDYFSGPFNIGTIPAGPAGGFGFVKTSSYMFKYINDSIYEGRGFPPDVVVPASDSAALFSGTDSALQAAINLINQ
jgi:carboxyl-terminal processing protease